MAWYSYEFWVSNDGQSWRDNNRILNDAQRFALVVTAIVGKRLTYTQLIAADAGRA